MTLNRSTFATNTAHRGRGRRDRHSPSRSPVICLNLPDDPEEALAVLPKRVTRAVGAPLIEHFFFEISPRSLEVWPLTWRRVNGKATAETRELFEVAKRKLDAAPAIRGGRRAAIEQQAA